MKQDGGAKAVEKMMQQYGCLPSIGEMTTISEFQARELAQGIESEINRAGDYGFTKITLHLDIPDAAKLAKYLRSK